jgi:hypothetical protein
MMNANITASGKLEKYKRVVTSNDMTLVPTFLKLD